MLFSTTSRIGRSDLSVDYLTVFTIMDRLRCNSAFTTLSCTKSRHSQARGKSIFFYLLCWSDAQFSYYVNFLILENSLQ